ncbi:hypothetical protein CLU79DRAFT_777482 [Phycomyces nitens]|nr:hypothetical protein CLU79DRAFT_777482 [Phycomyces nitens]
MPAMQQTKLNTSQMQLYNALIDFSQLELRLSPDYIFFFNKIDSSDFDFMTKEQNEPYVSSPSPCSDTSGQTDDTYLTGWSDDPKHPSDTQSLTPKRTKSGNPKVHQCLFCPKTFTRKYDLSRHSRTHTGVKPYECPHCRKAFFRTDGRTRHFQIEASCRNSPEVFALRRE